MKKKQMYQVLAGAVGVCFIVCLVSTVTAVAELYKNGGTFPLTIIASTILAGFCTVMIWRSVRNIED